MERPVISRAWAATGAGATGLVASMAVATDVLQFLTALIAFVSAFYGLCLMLKKGRGKH